MIIYIAYTLADPPLHEIIGDNVQKFLQYFKTTWGRDYSKEICQQNKPKLPSHYAADDSTDPVKWDNSKKRPQPGQIYIEHSLLYWMQGYLTKEPLDKHYSPHESSPQKQLC